MNRNHTYGDRNKTRAKLIMALVCGPVFSLALLGGMYLVSLIPEDLSDSARYVIWPTAASGCALLASAADRLGKRLNLTAQEFAAPAAFSCVLCSALACALLWTVLAKIHGG